MEANVDNSDFGTIVREARTKQGMSQMVLARKVGTQQQTIDKIERGLIRRSSFLPKILVELGIDLDKLITPVSVTPDKRRGHGQPPTDELLPVRGASPRAGRGFVLTAESVDFVVRPEPLFNVRDGYGIIIVENSMFPEFDIGDIALVHPHLPPLANTTCVFFASQGSGDALAVIRRLQRIGDEAWHVKAWTEKGQETMLSRSAWPMCHVIVGKYSRR